MIQILLLAVSLLSFQRDGLDLTLDASTKTIDPARNVYLTLTLKTAADKKVAPPDLRDRVRGFSLVEDFAEEPFTEKDGATTQVVNWMLVPEPCAKVYKIAPFVVGSHVAGPVYFEAPPPREAVTGGMEIDPQKDLPPLSWKLVGFCVAALLGALALGGLVWWALRFLARRVKEYRMSPIERAWVELDRLLKKGLPGRGRYKDFYVELTMVVRRYVQRKYGIKAPNLTTEEFLHEALSSGALVASREHLAQFLESADMVKFAGVEATPEMADEATESARGYLKGDTKTEVSS